MKKIILVLFLMLSIIVGCTSDNQVDTTKEPVDSINPLEPIEEEKISLINAVDEEWILKRIDSTNRSDADSILEFAKQALKEANRDDNIVSLYFLPTGLATNLYSYDPIMIKTNSDEEPLFMVLLMKEENKYLLGEFTKEDLVDNDYRNAAIKIYQKAADEVRNNLGLTDEDLFNFDIMMLYGFPISIATTEFKQLYEKSCEHYNKVTLALWSGDQNDIFVDNNMQYHRVTDEGINSKDDMTKYLEEAFTSIVASEIMDNFDPELYEEVGDKLYYVPIGVGGNVFIQDIEPIAVADSGLSMYVVIQCRIAEDFDDYGNYIGIHNEEYLFEYVDQGDGYRCCRFIDIPFGMFGY